MEKTASKKIENLELILAHEFYAMELKYEGYPYPQIIQMIFKKYGIRMEYATIASWFYKNGRLREYYDAYANQRHELEFAETKDLVHAHSKKAVITLLRVMSGWGGPQQVMAAKEILERTLGKVKDNVEPPAPGEVPTLELLKLAEQAENELNQSGQINKVIQEQA